MRRVSLLLLAISVSLAGCGGGGSTSSAVPQTSQAPQMPALGSSSNLALALSGQSGTQSGWGGPAKITINLASLRSPAKARWFDPTDGSYHDVAGEPLINRGHHQFTPPGKNHDGDDDWVLLLEASAGSR